MACNSRHESNNVRQYGCPECSGEIILHVFAEDERDGFDCPFCNGRGLLNEEELSYYKKWQNDLNEKSGVPKCY